MFVIDVPYINLDQIYNSKQAPRWIKLKESKYVIPLGDKALKVEQVRNRSDWNIYRLILSCTEEEFFNIWFGYFNLRTDYVDENIKIKKLGGKFKVIANRGFGIHTLNQDPFEAYVYSKLISKVGYNKAGELMNRIAMTYGTSHTQSMREAGKITWYEWPTPEAMLEKLNKEKHLGKVKSFLKRLCNAIIYDGFDITKSSNKLFRLFTLNDIDVFPLEEIEETIFKNFKWEPDDFADWYLSEIKNKGLVYLYILHHIKNPPQEVLKYGVN